jgi:hypothetical protein
MKDTIEALSRQAKNHKVAGQNLVDTILEIKTLLDNLMPPKFDFQHGPIAYVAQIHDENCYERGHGRGRGSAICCYTEELELGQESKKKLQYFPVFPNWKDAGSSDCFCYKRYANCQQIKLVAQELPNFLDALMIWLNEQNGKMEEATATLRKMLEAVTIEESMTKTMEQEEKIANRVGVFEGAKMVYDSPEFDIVLWKNINGYIVIDIVRNSVLLDFGLDEFTQLKNILTKIEIPNQRSTESEEVLYEDDKYTVIYADQGIQWHLKDRHNCTVNFFSDEWYELLEGLKIIDLSADGEDKKE